MAQTDSSKVVCPGCKTVYGWKPAVANRKILCKCGVLMRMPATAGAPATFIEKRAAPPKEVVKRAAEHHAHQQPAPSQPTPPAVRKPVESQPAEQLDALEVVEDEPLPALEPVSEAVPVMEKAPAKQTDDAESIELNLLEDPPAAPAPPPPQRPAPAKPAVPTKPAPKTPAVKPPAEEGEAYEIEFPGEPAHAKPVAAPAANLKPLPGGRCPSCGTTLKGGATLCLNCGLDLETGKKMATTVVKDEGKAEDSGEKVAAAMAVRPGMSKLMPPKREPAEDEPNHLVTEVFVPLGLLVVGTILILLHAFVLGPKAASSGGIAAAITGGGSGYSVIAEMTKAGVQFFFSLPFLLAGLFIVAHLFGSSFGPMLPALIKLVAMSLVLIGTGHCTDDLLEIITEGFGMLASQIKFPIEFGVFWALSAWLFDMDFMEMFVLWLAVSLIPTILFALFIMSMLGL